MKSAPHKLARAAARAWDICACRVEGWPQVLLSVPLPPQGWTLPWSAFPASFREDKDLWITRRSGTDLLDDDSLTRRAPPGDAAHRQVQPARGGIGPGAGRRRRRRDPIAGRPRRSPTASRSSANTCWIGTASRPSTSTASSAISPSWPGIMPRLPDADLAKLRGICRRLRIKRTGPTATSPRTAERHRGPEEPAPAGAVASS